MNEAREPKLNDRSKLTECVRVCLTRRAIKRFVSMLGTGELFLESQKWPGYGLAAESAHRAIWRLFDEEVQRLPQPAKQWLQSWLQRKPNFDTFDWVSFEQAIERGEFPRLPKSDIERKNFVAEYLRQTMLSRVGQFARLWNGPARQRSDFFESFAGDMAVAAETGLQSFFILLAEPRRPTDFKSVNDRQLKYQLASLWMPACLWAISTGGVAKVLEELYPRSGPYTDRAVAIAVRSLHLWRQRKPTYWGVKIRGGRAARFLPL